MRKYAQHGTIAKYYKGCRCIHCRDAHAATNRTWGRSNKDKVCIYNRRKNLKQYGLTLEQYDKILERQGGVCGICKKTCKTGKRLAVDHDHDTGFVRGLLCYVCNQRLGWLDPIFSDVLDYYQSATGGRML